jgi:hypothetical protein
MRLEVRYVRFHGGNKMRDRFLNSWDRWVLIL